MQDMQDMQDIQDMQDNVGSVQSRASCGAAQPVPLCHPRINSAFPTRGQGDCRKKMEEGVLEGGGEGDR